MKKILILFTFLFLLVSCKSTKKISEVDKSSSVKDTETTSLLRKGEIITIDIPNYNFKDTLITRTNYETKSVATVYYDKNGNQRFECQTAELNEWKQLVREQNQNDINNTSDIKNEFNPQYFIYALAIFGLIICVLFFLVIRIQNNIPKITASIVKEMLSQNKSL